MYSGWLIPFRHGKQVSASEEDCQLLQHERLSSSDNFGCLIRFNSTFIELVDRRFRQRGMVLTLFVVGICAYLLGFWASGFIEAWTPDVHGELEGFSFRLSFITVAFSVTIGFMYWLVIGKDFFTFTHYPIRFNRKTRMVHAFLGKQDGIVVSVPWEKAFFHIGHASGDESYLRDIRCHMVEGEDRNILHTFAVGHYFDDEDKIRAIWEFIRRYMEEGPENVFEDPSAKIAKLGGGLTVPLRRIDLSVVPSLRNTFNWIVMAMPESWFELRYVLAPLYSPLVLCRWLVMKSSKAPVWPAEIEAESKVDANDPYNLPEPHIHVAWGEL